MDSEFRGRGGLLAGAAVGLTAGMTATMFYSLGAFIPALEAEFGWSRADLSFAVTLLTIAVFIFGVPFGQLCDRFGAARVATLSLVVYAAALVVMALTVSRVEGFWLAYFLIAAIGVGSTPIVMIRPVANAFERQRGLAMGIALTGAGISGFWVPRFTTALIETYDWRIAYMGLAAISLAAAPIVWLSFRRHDSGADIQAQADRDGMSLAEARNTRTFWLLSAMAIMMASGVAGLVVHLVPMFRDLGADPASAAATASMLGLASVVGRLIIGTLLDRFPASAVSLVVLALAALGAALIAGAGLELAVVAVLLLGLAAGAEIDLLSYLTSRHFGSKAYGAIYGWQYSIFALGYGISPFVAGKLRDSLGNYDAALATSAVLVGASGLVSLALGPYRYGPRAA